MFSGASWAGKLIAAVAVISGIGALNGWTLVTTEVSRAAASDGLTVFTELVDLSVVTVAIPYLFSACAQLSYLVSGRRRVHGRLLARDLTIAAAGTLFSLWVTFAAGYSAVYQAMIVVLAGVILYAFLQARRAPRDQATTHNPATEA